MLATPKVVVSDYFEIVKSAQKLPLRIVLGCDEKQVHGL